MDFYYELEHTDGMTQEQIAEVEQALAIKAYVCQQEFERTFDLYHEINILPEADDEAFVAHIDIEKDADYAEAHVILNCSRVRMS